MKSNQKVEDVKDTEQLFSGCHNAILNCTSDDSCCKAMDTQAD